MNKKFVFIMAFLVIRLAAIGGATSNPNGSVGLKALAYFEKCGQDSIRARIRIANDSSPAVEISLDDISLNRVTAQISRKIPKVSKTKPGLIDGGSGFGAGGGESRPDFPAGRTVQLQWGEELGKSLSIPVWLLDLTDSERKTLTCASLDSILSLDLNFRIPVRRIATGEVIKALVKTHVVLQTSSGSKDSK
ncbi:MAG: hypothetical protein ABIW76_03585 [Fibrobacteria bacterium]